jgi:PAS domain S-box-containing protein
VAEPRIAASEGRFSEYRELVLGVVFGVLLATLAVLFQEVVGRFALDIRLLSVIAFFSAGLLFGLVLWAGSRRAREERRVQGAIASVNTGGVVVDDKDGRIVFANAKMCEMVGLSRAEIRTKNFAEIIAPDSRQLADAEFVRRRLGASSVYETNLRHADGSELTVLVSSQSLMSHEKYRGSAAFVLDITARKASEREVTQAKELAEFFLDLITHDISNVNQGVRGYSELLSSVPEMPTNQRQGYITRILTQIDRANALITNIKKISELRWAWREAPTGSIDVEESIRQSIAMAMSSFASRQVEVAFLNRAGRLAAKGDYLATELFYNLLHNAIKYTPGQAADVSVEVDRAASGSAVVRVIDKGPGIPDSAKGAVFARMSPLRGERAPSGYHSGTGLTLVRLIADRFGWRVWVEDRVRGDSSKGAAFCVEIPPAERGGAG